MGKRTQHTRYVHGAQSTEHIDRAYIESKRQEKYIICPMLYGKEWKREAPTLLQLAIHSMKQSNKQTSRYMKMCVYTRSQTEAQKNRAMEEEEEVAKEWEKEILYYRTYFTIILAAFHVPSKRTNLWAQTVYICIYATPKLCMHSQNTVEWYEHSHSAYVIHPIPFPST